MSKWSGALITDYSLLSARKVIVSIYRDPSKVKELVLLYDQRFT